MSGRSLLTGLGGIAAGLVLCAGAVLPVSAATATANSGANGLKVSPVTTNIVINPGETQTVQITVQNVTSSAMDLQAIVNDFIASNNESGAPALLLDPSQYAPTHSLKRYVAPINSFTLQPGGQRVVTATISIPKNAPGGGYYGAVRFTPAEAPGSSNVTLSASVGSLILVRVPGDAKEQLNLISFDIRNTDDDAPRVIFTSGNKLEAVARFQNVGDVQEQPFGKILLKQGNKQLAEYELNNTEPRGNVLPDSIRKFTVALDKVGAIGQYTVYGNLGYGTNGQLLSAQTTFYVIPIGLIGAGMLLLAITLFVIFGLPRLIRNYNRHVIERATRR